MASQEIQLIAIMKPLPGKIDELAAHLVETSENIQRTEPGTLAWYIVQPEGGDELIAVERHDAESLKLHSKSGHLKALTEAVGPLLREPPTIKVGRQIAGFRREEKL
ncbi:hypothetical protein ACJ73_00001 [Blastomyces percursus]|uniref:ABM domain-containing protein n=1 Tax=Blastomyces percursus TaxID=1658174 RepID=A0A1J9QJA9_9EURO|nr:hypothetical protein ACJ73_00001 [Blastomyces percursus]